MAVKGPYEVVHYWICASTDTKPTEGVSVGDELFETNTRLWYIYNGSTWSQKIASASGQDVYTTSADPASSDAVTQTIVDAYSGVIITLTTTGNAQTIADPTIITAGKRFVVINNDSSTNTIDINGTTLAAGDAQLFVWDGTVWLTVDNVYATTGSAGVVELATDAETAAGTSSTLATTPSGVLAAIREHEFVTFNYWFQASNVLGTVYASSAAERTELVNANPDTLSNIYYKSTVANTATPFTITSGTILDVHFNAKVDSTVTGKTVTLKAALYYVDSDGTSNATQIGETSDAGSNLTTSKAAYPLHIHVTSDTIVPSGKRLWLKLIATPSTLTGYSPTVSVWDGEADDHILIPVSGSVLGRFLQLAGGTMTGTVFGCKGADFTGATVDLSTATGNAVDLTTDTTALSTFGTVTAGSMFHLRFMSARTLTHNGTSFILPGARDIVTEAGDCGCFVSLGSGNWYCAFFMKANGRVLGDVIVATDSSTSNIAAAQMRGQTHVVTGAYTLSLPTAAIGYSASFYASTAAVFSIDLQTGTDVIILNGTALTAGNKATSDGTINAECYVECRVAGKYSVFSNCGLFVDGGA